MKFVLTIELGNDKMRTSRHLRDALRQVGERVMGAVPSIIKSIDSGRIRDVNGNTVGEWKIEED